MSNNYINDDINNDINDNELLSQLKSYIDKLEKERDSLLNQNNSLLEENTRLKCQIVKMEKYLPSTVSFDAEIQSYITSD